MKQKLDDCNLCPLREQCTQVVWGRGNKDAKLAIFAEAPGKEEDRYGMPLVGSSGFLTEKMLMSVGIDPNDVYYSNVVKCRPEGNRTPNKPEIKTCTSNHLTQELRELPNLEWVWIFGKTSYYGFYKKDPKITQELGRVDVLNLGDDKIIQSILLFHPSFLMRSPSMDPGSAKEKQWKQIVTWKEQHFK